MISLSYFRLAAVAAIMLLVVLPRPPLAQHVTPEEQGLIVKTHNTYRALHCAPPLTWSDELAASAQQWAEKCAKKHGPHGRFGENLAWGPKRTAVSAIQDWYKGAGKYNYDKPGFTHGIGHFTQMIWKKSSQVGCGVADCPNIGRLWVCRYTPAGNWSGQFQQNVLKRCR